MKSSATRLYNFSAGPAVLPVPVLEQAQRDLISLPGVGMSVLEVSHRSKPFEEILARTDADIRALAGVPEHYRVLFLQGGASLQFSMVPLNLLTEGRTADYVMTGSWAEKAAKEARRVGSVNLKEWVSAPVWQDPARCIAYLPKSNSGSLESPRISEEGRQFLANLLTQLTDAQLHDLFEVARFPQRWDPAENPENATTVEQWVDAFKTKRNDVVNHHCVSP